MATSPTAPLGQRLGLQARAYFGNHIDTSFKSVKQISNPDHAIFSDYLWSLLPSTSLVVAISHRETWGFFGAGQPLRESAVQVLWHRETARTTRGIIAVDVCRAAPGVYRNRCTNIS